MVVRMDVSLLFLSDNNGCTNGCVIVFFRVTTMVVRMDVSLFFSE